jgi:hypothetical protein
VDVGGHPRWRWALAVLVQAGKGDDAHFAQIEWGGEALVSQLALHACGPGQSWGVAVVLASSLVALTGKGKAAVLSSLGLGWGQAADASAQAASLVARANMVRGGSALSMKYCN